MMRPLILPAALLLAVFWAFPVRAGLIVSVDDLQLQPGGTGLLDVWIESDGSDPLQTFQGEFRVTPAVGTTTRLEFSPLSQPDASLHSDYVFFSNSDDYEATVSTTTTPNDTVLAGDFTADLSDVTVTTAKLLARFAVTHNLLGGDPATTLGHSFEIALIPSSGDSNGFLLGQSNTGFVDTFFDPIAFSSTSGTVTIAQASAVPEPSSLALLGMGALSLTGYGWRRRRRHG